MTIGFSRLQMSDDLRRGLIQKKGGFEKAFEEGLMRVAKIRQKNDVFQKHLGGEGDDEMKDQIHDQSQYIQKEIKELRDLLIQMENKYRDPESKLKVKQLKADAHKQIERNKIILKDFININYTRRSQGSRGSRGKENQNLVEGGAIDYGYLGVKADKQPKKDSLVTDQGESQMQIEIDYEVERKMLLEKNQMINQVEQSTQRINDIINDMGIEVEEQGNNLDVISDELMNTNRNLVQTNEQLDEANNLQKKAKKKYIFMIVLILLIILAVGGVIFFLTQ